MVEFSVNSMHRTAKESDTVLHHTAGQWGAKKPFSNSQSNTVSHNGQRLLFFFNFIFKLYSIVLVLPNIEMNPPQVYMCSPS